MVAAGAVLVLGTGPIAAEDVEVQYNVTDQGYKLEIEGKEASHPPRVIIRERARAPEPAPVYRFRGETAPATPAPSVQTESIVPSPRIVTHVYRYREVLPRHESRWYGDSYADGIYTLREYNLRDDYTLYNRQDQVPTARLDVGRVAPPSDVLGFVGPEETNEPRTPPATHEVTGQVRELRLVKLSRVAEPGVVAMVETDDGLARRVFLGPRDEARKLDLRLGDRITAAGRPRIVDGRSVLIASRVRVGESVDHTAVPQSQWYHGIIQGTRVLQPINRPDRHLVAMVELDDGNRVRVDLGPVRELPHEEIQPNDRVAILAYTVSVDGEPVLMAETLRLQGETLRIRRP